MDEQKKARYRLACIGGLLALSLVSLVSVAPVFASDGYASCVTTAENAYEDAMFNAILGSIGALALGILLGGGVVGGLAGLYTALGLSAGPAQAYARDVQACENLLLQT